MNAPAEAFRCQSLAKEIAAELRAKVRSESSMLAGQRVLITKFDRDPSRAVGSARHKRCSWVPFRLISMAVILGWELGASYRFFFVPNIRFQFSLYALDTGFWPSPLL
jgi:hypothetical protein